MRARDVKPGMQLVIVSGSLPRMYGIAIDNPYQEPGERYHRIPIMTCNGLRAMPRSIHVYEYRNGKIIWWKLV